MGTTTQGAMQTLNFIADKQYKVSHTKVHLLRQEVHYLGLILTPRECKLFQERIWAVEQWSPPSNGKQLKVFLVLQTIDFRICTIGKTPNEVLKGRVGGYPLIWEPEQKAFYKLKSNLLQAPALGLPKKDGPFQLCITEKQGLVPGILIQALGLITRPVAYLSKNWIRCHWVGPAIFGQ